MNVRRGLVIVTAAAAMQACGGDDGATDTAKGAGPITEPSALYRVAGSPQAPLHDGATYRFRYSGGTPGYGFETDGIPHGALRFYRGALIGVAPVPGTPATFPRLALRQGGSVSDVAGTASYVIGRWHHGAVDLTHFSTASSAATTYDLSKDSLHYLAVPSLPSDLPATGPLMRCVPEAWTTPSIDGAGLAETVIAAATLELNGASSKAYLSITPVVQNVGYGIATPGGTLPGPTNGIPANQTWMGHDDTVITPMVFDVTATEARLGVVYRSTASPGTLRGAIVLHCLAS